MAISNGYYEANAEATYAVYGLIGGVWTFLNRQTVQLYGGFSNGGMKTLYAYDQIIVSTSAQVDAFKVVQESGTVTGASATWTSQTTSSVRSATPNGQTVTTTVRPN